MNFIRATVSGAVRDRHIYLAKEKNKQQNNGNEHSNKLANMFEYDLLLHETAVKLNV